MIGSEKPNENVNVEQPEKDPDAKNKKRLSPFAWVLLLFIIAVSLIWLGQHLGFFEWAYDWLSLDSRLTAPVATLLASSGVIIAASIAFWNGEKTRREERDKWAESRQQEIERHEDEKTKWEESKQRETVRSLRDRYFNITELLSGNNSYAQREAAVYSLVALSDDWASLYGNGTEAAVREQQTCLNVIVGQLRDQFPDEDDKDDHEKSRKRSELIAFKQRVQGLITQRYRPSTPSNPGEWSHLDLDLSFCHLYKPDFSRCAFAAKALFTSAEVTGDTNFQDATFTGDTNFQDATFTGITNFQDATFTGTAYFFKGTFTGITNFQEATFTGITNFQDATFTGTTTFRGATFTDAAYFQEAIFNGAAYFSQAIFNGAARFFKAAFNDDTSFFWTAFNDDTDFFWTAFNDDTDFKRVTFRGDARFWNATFSGNADFRWAGFRGSTDFWEAGFRGDADFREAGFPRDANFGEATFGGTTDFREAKFTGDTSFKEKEDQLPDRQTHEDRKTTSTTPFFDGPSQFTELPQFNETVFSACPTLIDEVDPRDFFVGAIFLDEQEVEE